MTESELIGYLENNQRIFKTHKKVWDKVGFFVVVFLFTFVFVFLRFFLLCNVWYCDSSGSSCGRTVFISDNLYLKA